LRDYIKLERKLAEPDAPREVFPKKEMPTWVKRWVCARFLYARFGRERDERPFREQEQFCGPTREYMPPIEWAEEAKAVSSREAWDAIGSVTGLRAVPDESF
jgi:hypothetical protein